MESEKQVSPAVNETAAQPEVPQPILADVIQETEIRRLSEKLKVEEARFTFQQRRAKLFAASKLFTTKEIPEDQALAQAMVKIELGEAMGFVPAESLQGIHIINGQTAVASALRAARMQAAGYSWDIDWLGPEGDCTGCRLWMYFKGQPMLKPKRDDKGNILRDEAGEPIMEHVSLAYTKADAEKMKTKIWEGPEGHRTSRTVSILEKDNWKMSPRNMYFARNITNAQRFYAPAVLSINLPSVEELDADADADVRAVRGTSKAALEVAKEKIRRLGGHVIETEDDEVARLEAERVRKEAEQDLPPAGEGEPPKPQPEAGPAPAPTEPRAAVKAVREVDELPDPLSVEDDRLYVGGILFERNPDKTAWRRVSQEAKGPEAQAVLTPPPSPFASALKGRRGK